MRLDRRLRQLLHGSASGRAFEALSSAATRAVRSLRRPYLLNSHPGATDSSRLRRLVQLTAKSLLAQPSALLTLLMRVVRHPLLASLIIAASAAPIVLRAQQTGVRAPSPRRPPAWNATTASSRSTTTSAPASSCSRCSGWIRISSTSPRSPPDSAPMRSVSIAARRATRRVVRFERFGPRVLLVEPEHCASAATADSLQAHSVEESFATSTLAVDADRGRGGRPAARRCDGLRAAGRDERHLDDPATEARHVSGRSQSQRDLPAAHQGVSQEHRSRGAADVSRATRPGRRSRAIRRIRRR